MRSRGRRRHERLRRGETSPALVTLPERDLRRHGTGVRRPRAFAPGSVQVKAERRARRNGPVAFGAVPGRAQLRLPQRLPFRPAARHLGGKKGF